MMKRHSLVLPQQVFFFSLAMRCSTWLDQVDAVEMQIHHIFYIPVTGTTGRVVHSTHGNVRLNLADKEVRCESWLWKIKRLWRNVAH